MVSLGIGFGLTNSWFGISASLITGIQSGGPMLIIYGIIIIAFISYCIGITLSELSSAIPSAGGQYVWTRVLSPRKYSGFLSYLCGSLAWAGSLFTSALMALSIALTIMGFWNLMHPDHVTKSWELFVVYQIVNASLVIFNCYGKYLPFIANGALYTSLFLYVVITITVLACAKGNYQSADFVFVTFENGTGWKSAGIAFIVGLINPNWSFSCLDLASHLAEEVHNADSVIPIAILGTVTIGMVTSLTYAIAMFFCVTNLDNIINHGTGLPILDIYHQALNNRAVAVLGCLYLASSTAFNSMVVGCITFLLLSYMVPTVCLLYRGRNNIKHGCFWLGKLGLFANVMTIAWALFALGFYSLPSFMPVTAGTMNYVCVVYGVYAVLAMGYWFFPIKKYSCRAHFAGGLGNNEEEEFPDVCLTQL
ncbi:hypothetical protein HF325_002922 [Metschnikowia pulcherrima]|uniref:Choline transport protein n=1 Tax=Metschnikowia pulcherrima TaxID=27326 RepID=A0A8H7GSU9_9ASCO|nr:hypothetical protein HF325_002922 [Metschnikowia pulcherrima]